MVFGFGKKDKHKGTSGSGRQEVESVVARGPSLPPEIETKDAAKWEKLLGYVKDHPLFQYTTFDGLFWIDPFKAELISAPFDLSETVKKHLAKNHHWMQGKLKTVASLLVVKWIQYLQENLDTDKRFSLFQSDGLWYNPWSKSRCRDITLDLFSKRKAFIKAVATEMAQYEDATPRETLSLEKLQQVMQGTINAEQAEREERERKEARNSKTSMTGIKAVDSTGGLVEEHHTGPTIKPMTPEETGAIAAPVAHDGEPVIEGDGSFGDSLSGGMSDFKMGVGQRASHGGKMPSNNEIWKSLQQINERLAVQGQAPVTMPGMPSMGAMAGAFPAGGYPAGTPAPGMPTGASMPPPDVIQELMQNFQQANAQLSAIGQAPVPFPPAPPGSTEPSWDELLLGMRQANDHLSAQGQMPMPLPGGLPVMPAVGAPAPGADVIRQLLQGFFQANQRLTTTGQEPVPAPALSPGGGIAWEQVLSGMLVANQRLMVQGQVPVALPGGLPVVPAGGGASPAGGGGISVESLLQSVQQANERLMSQGQVPVPLPPGASGAPGANAPSYAELWQSIQQINQRLAMSGPMVVPTNSVVFPAAQQLFNGLISLRTDMGPRDDAEDGEPGTASIGGSTGAVHHVPANVPIMHQGDLSPELIQQLVDSLRQVSLVASNVSAYKPGSRAAGSSRALTRKRKDAHGAEEKSVDLSPFEEADAEAGDEEASVPQVRTDSFIDPNSSLDIDKAFARLQARQARGDVVEEVQTDDVGIGGGAVGGDFSLDVEEGDTVGDVGEDLLSDDEEKDYDDRAQDMEKAVNVQNHLLGGIPDLNDVEIALHYEPYAEIGGDFYNVIKLNDDRFFFIVGDVAGHGVQAALIVSSIVNTLRIIFRSRDNHDLLDIVSELNDYMRDCLMTGQFFTAFCGILTTGRRPVLDCICAGHHPSICLNKNHEEPIREVGKLGMGIGLVRSKTFRSKTEVASYELNPGDTICIYTDGIVEVMDENGEELGDAFARSSFFSHMDETIDGLVNAVLEDIHAEMVGEIPDDQTIMVIKILPPATTDAVAAADAETADPDTYGPGDAPTAHPGTRAALTGEILATDVDGALDAGTDGVVVDENEFQTDIPAIRLEPGAIIAEADHEPADAPDGVIQPKPVHHDTDIVFDVDGVGPTGMQDFDDED